MTIFRFVFPQTPFPFSFLSPPPRNPQHTTQRSLSLSSIPRTLDFAMKGGKSKAEAPKKADTKLSVKRKATEKAVSKKPAKSAKAAKDPNKPKRPPSAFFVFMEEFRKEFKEKNPKNKSVSVVGKAAGDRWKSMTSADKAPYEAKAAKRKTEYAKTLAAYNKKQADGASKKKVEEEEEDESDKSKSEVHDDDEEEEDESGEDEEDDDDDE